MINEFTSYLTAIKGYSTLTAQAYQSDLYEFTKYMKEYWPGIGWSGIVRQHIDEYITLSRKSGYAATTINRRLSAISELYKYMIRQGYKVENPCLHETRAKIQKRVPNTIDRKELNRAYENASGKVKTMIGILATTGIRLQELLDLTIDSIDETRSTITVLGKGAKGRTIYANPYLISRIKADANSTPRNETIYAYCQREARKLIYEALKPYCTSKQLSPHAIRHTYATAMADNGVPTATLAQILGHNSLNTTQIYIDRKGVNTIKAQASNQIINLK